MKLYFVKEIEREINTFYAKHSTTAPNTPETDLLVQEERWSLHLSWVICCGPSRSDPGQLAGTNTPVDQLQYEKKKQNSEVSNKRWAKNAKLFHCSCFCNQMVKVKVP